MQIQNLATTELPVIVRALGRAFDDYFVKMPDSVDYWKGRFKGARVDFSLSYGVFDEGKLVAFIINGIDIHDGKRTAFNTGTGVVASHRGQQLVDKLYAYAMSFFQAAKIEKCMLDVIEQNAKAIRVYERIGFYKKRRLLCFKGTIETATTDAIIEAVPFTKVIEQDNIAHQYYSWDNTNAAITSAAAVYDTYWVKNAAQEKVGHFVINPNANYVAQLEATPIAIGANFEHLMNGIQQIRPTIRITNIDEQRTEYVKNLLRFGLENHINQYEMEMLLD